MWLAQYFPSHTSVWLGGATWQTSSQCIQAEHLWGSFAFLIDIVPSCLPLPTFLFPLRKQAWYLTVQEPSCNSEAISQRTKGENGEKEIATGWGSQWYYGDSPGGPPLRVLIQPFSVCWVFCYLQPNTHLSDAALSSDNETAKDEGHLVKRKGQRLKRKGKWDNLTYTDHMVDLIHSLIPSRRKDQNPD